MSIAIENSKQGAFGKGATARQVIAACRLFQTPDRTSYLSGEPEATTT
jgi:hypothetical protein